MLPLSSSSESPSKSNSSFMFRTSHLVSWSVGQLVSPCLSWQCLGPPGESIKRDTVPVLYIWSEKRPRFVFCRDTLISPLPVQLVLFCSRELRFSWYQKKRRSSFSRHKKMRETAHGNLLQHLPPPFSIRPFVHRFIHSSSFILIHSVIHHE